MPQPKAPTRFEGFADADARFFRALARHQDRDWFAAHRAEYEQGWRLPMQALLAELRERIDRLYPLHPIAEPKVFRIHRDVRFSKDKAPYKTHIGGFLALGSQAGPAVPCALYVHLGAEERFAAAGHYMMQGPQLSRFREAVLDDEIGRSLATIVSKLERAGYAAGAYESLKQVPRGIDPAHPRAALLRRKGLIVSFPEMPAALLPSRKLLDWLTTHAKRTAPLVSWLANLED